MPCFCCGKTAKLDAWWWPVTADAKRKTPLNFSITFKHDDGECIWQFAPQVYGPR